MVYEINLKILKNFNFLKIKIKSIIFKNIFKTKKNKNSWSNELSNSYKF